MPLVALARRRSVREYAEDPLTQAEIGRLLWAADLRVPLGTVALGQVWLSRAPAVFVISGDVSRTAVKYGVRAERHALMQAGHAAQNLLVQAVALGLAATPVDAFEDDSVTRLRRPRS